MNVYIAVVLTVVGGLATWQLFEQGEAIGVNRDAIEANRVTLCAAANIVAANPTFPIGSESRRHYHNRVRAYQDFLRLARQIDCDAVLKGAGISALPQASGIGEGSSESTTPVSPRLQSEAPPPAQPGRRPGAPGAPGPQGPPGPGGKPGAPSVPEPPPPPGTTNVVGQVTQQICTSVGNPAPLCQGGS